MWKDVALSGAPGSLDLPDHNDAPSWFLKCGKIGIVWCACLAVEAQILQTIMAYHLGFEMTHLAAHMGLWHHQEGVPCHTLPNPLHVHSRWHFLNPLWHKACATGHPHAASLVTPQLASIPHMALLLWKRRSSLYM